jgi:TPR repeat protein
MFRNSLGINVLCGKASKSLVSCAATFAICAMVQLFLVSFGNAGTGDLQQNASGTVTEQRHFVAFSLKTAEALVRKAQQDHTDFRQDRVLFGLGGMSKPKALFFESQTNDWILLGERSGDAGDLTLDDLAVALRTRVENPTIDPGVTIEPIAPGEENAETSPKDWNLATRQQVEFRGSLKDTRFGLTCYEADWLMKRMDLGLEKLPNAPIPSFFDSGGVNQLQGPTTIVSRFWLCPVLSDVPVLSSQKAVFIQESRIVVNRQTLFAERDGQAIQDPNELNALDVAGKNFASAFTDHYDEAARDRPVFERLRGLARLAGLAKGVVVGKWVDDFKFFLQEYKVATVETPSEVDVLHNEDRSLRQTVRGGVQLRNLAMRLRNGDITALTEAVSKMRPKPDSISWEFLFGDTFLALPSDEMPGANGKSDLVKGTPEEVRWWCKAADDGDVDAMILVAESYRDGNVGLPKNEDEALRWYRRAADAGNARGMFGVGVCYQKGFGAGTDIHQAIAWYRKAAGAGDVTAMFNLGYQFQIGDGADQDFAQSLIWYKKAADAGDADAMCNIGLLYEHGDGVPQDYATAMLWYHKAFDAGMVGVMSNIGMLYDKGLGVDQNYSKAMDCYRKAAGAGDAVAMNNIGSLYATGAGVMKDYEEAMKWFRQASEVAVPDGVSPNGQAGAMNSIGFMYMNGFGVERDYTEAMHWFHKAADLGSSSAMCNIGLLYERGWGVQQDESHAATWYRQAAGHGDSSAKDWLANHRAN